MSKCHAENGRVCYNSGCYYNHEGYCMVGDIDTPPFVDGDA